MQTVTATYRIVTPMFLGGAEHEAESIRPPSIKGALRFWWRAMSWGRFYQQENQDEEKAMIALHAKEAWLFGLAAKTENGRQVGGQGQFLLTVRNNNPTVTDKGVVHPNLKHLTAARYLGYGVIEAFGSIPKNIETGQLIRSCIGEDSTFTVILAFRDKVDDSVLYALKAMGLLGGLGSRSRRGMGSIALESLTGDGMDAWTTPANADDYDARVKELFSGAMFPAIEPPFSAFWVKSRVVRLLLANSPYQILDDFGNKMLDYRSWGRTTDDGKRCLLPSNKQSEERFADDHDWYRIPGWAAKYPKFHPERVEFGLPHNYHKKHHHVISEKHERRSSPLLFHVHPVGKQFIGVGIYLPAQFLPNGEKIKANDINVPAKIPWKIITGFLDGKVGNPATTVDRFPAPAKKAVLP